MGARQLLSTLYGAAQSEHVHFNRPGRIDYRSDTYHATLRGYDFCLSVAGNSFCPRIADYAASGCIPVLVRPGMLLWPHEPDLDYSTFSLSVGFDDLPRLPDILANMSDAQVRAKRWALREVHRAFIWDEEYGRAYEVSMAGVMRRLRA